MNLFEFHSITHSSDGREFKIYKIINYTTNSIDLKSSIAVARGNTLGKTNELNDLPAIYKVELLDYHKERIRELREIKKKFIFVIDLTNFPYIGCTFDFRDPSLDGANSRFTKDIVTQWNNTSGSTVGKNIIVIVVNLHDRITGPKLIEFDY